MAENTDLESEILKRMERLVIDKETDSIEHIKNIDNSFKVSHKYEVKGKVEELIQRFDNKDFLKYIEGNPYNVIDTPDDKNDYKITIDYDKGEQRTIAGSYDKKALPEDFPVFISEIFDFIVYYNYGDIFNSAIYGKVRPTDTEYIFCSVRFKNGWKTYYYITEDYSIEVGDFVVVPVGKYDRIAVVKVVEIGYFKEDYVPWPLERTKKILRKATEDEIEEEFYYDDDENEYEYY